MFEGLADVPMGMEMLIELPMIWPWGHGALEPLWPHRGGFAEPVAFDGTGDHPRQHVRPAGPRWRSARLSARGKRPAPGQTAQAICHPSSRLLTAAI
jgi:hypothetical protein